MAVDQTYRLPRQAVPRRYELELHPDLGAARFDGRVRIEVELLEPCQRLVLNALELDVHDARLDTAGGDGLSAEVSFDQPNQMVTLAFDRQVEPGLHHLSIRFTGILNDQLRGFYRSTFRDQDGQERVIATTQFEATDARRAFPCWDEPDFKAVFSVTLVVEEGLTGLSNAPLVSSRVRDDGRVEMRFADTMVMSTYLVAFVVGPYQLTEADVVDGIPVRVAAVPGKLALTGYAVQVARHALRFLSDYFGIPYPGGKLDHVAVPDFAFGAMENLGCVTYRESLLLAEPESAAQTELQRIATVVAHETAHMWFGDLVTMKWWDGIWLNEAFATFMELTTSDAFRPDWQVWTAFGAGKAAALSIDGLVATRPVEFPVGRPEEAEGMFDVLTYQKGGSVLKMLEQYLGAEVFRKGISHYLATHAYGNTQTSDLWDAIETVSGEPVRTIMGTWIHQGGYPTVYASLGDDPSTVVLHQKRFLYSAGAADSAGAGTEARWAVPVNLRASVGGTVQHERLLLEQEAGSYTFSGPVDWVVVNDGAWGFYRTRYSAELWQRLAAAGPESVLAPLERLQLVGDTWAAVVSGEAALEEWAAAASAVSADPDPDVWASLAGVLYVLDLIGDDEDREALRRFTLRLARPPWAAVGWDPRPGEDNRAATARARILTVLAEPGRDQEVIDEARRRVTAHLDAPDHGVLAPDLIRAAAQIAVAEGGPEAWHQVLDAYRREEGPQDQLRYLHALAETPFEDLRIQTLELMLSQEVRSQDAPFVIAGVLSRRGAAVQSWRWVEDNWARIAERFPPTLLVRVLEATAAFVEPELAERVHAFCRETELAISAVRVQQILERMDVHVALAGRLRGHMAAALS
ncbi:MAG TPA: M1 family aminopeptidase [Acidimicrobiales bacterium]|nr:M1 family aminopeptidase [Acidimicrobiales bacterium]